MPSPITTILLALAVGLSLSACSEQSDDATSSGRGYGSREVPVVASSAKWETLTETIKAVGTARALQSVTLYPETAGFVTGIHFRPDDTVAAGQVLLQLDNRDERLAVELAEVKLADAERLLERYSSVNRQRVNIAESEIDSAQAAVASANIALKQARVALDRRAIKAPFAGRVGLSDIDVGDRIEPSMIITSLDNRSQLLISFTVPEAFIGQVRPGTPVTVELWDIADTPFTGEITDVDSRIDQTSRAFTVRAKVDNRDDLFRPGMSFEISINVSRGEYLSVPDVAVQWGADGAYVWIEVDGKATRREVTLVKRLPNRLLLEGDIQPGTPVIAEGVQAVREGVALRLLDAGELDRDARLELAQPSTPSEGVNNGG